MIIFYNKKTGKVIGTIDGRVHGKEHMQAMVSNTENPPKDVAKMVIGYEEKGRKVIGHNLDHFEKLKDFESTSPNTPFHYKIDVKSNKLVRVKK